MLPTDPRVDAAGSDIDQLEFAFPIPDVPFLAIKAEGISRPHYHAGDVWEITYVSHGEGYYFIGPNLYPVRRPMIVFSDPRDIHWFSGRGAKRLIVVFSMSYLKRMAGSIAEEGLECLESQNRVNRNVLYPPADSDTQIEFLFSSTVREIEERKPCFEKLVAQYIATILTLCRRYATLEPDERHEYGDTQEDLIRGVLKYIDSHLTSKMPLPALSRIAGVTESYLSTLFNRITAHSIPDYVAGQRVLLARRLLETTDMKVISVSFESGFVNVSSFNRMFRQKVGVTPQQYRKIRKV